MRVPLSSCLPKLPLQSHWYVLHMFHPGSGSTVAHVAVVRVCSAGVLTLAGQMFGGGMKEIASSCCTLRAAGLIQPDLHPPKGDLKGCEILF